MKRLGFMAALTGVALCVTPVHAQAAPSHPPTTPIQHLVVMTQDQHSFDNYFGTRAGVDGIPAGVCMPLRAGSHQPCVAPFALGASTTRAQLRATGEAQKVAVNGGRMDGFVQAQASHREDGKVAMGHYLPQDVSTLTDLAARGVVFDRWFSAVPGGSIANRYFEITARSPGDVGEVPTTGWGRVPTIFDRLTAAGVSWRVYVENYEPALTIKTASARARRGGQVARVPLLAMPAYLRNPATMAHVVDLSQYYVDLSAGTLPSVSYVVSTTSSEHAPATPARGQQLIRAVANALIASPEWRSSAFALQYDSSGGWYDHVAPPIADGAQLGLRVPAVLLSPYVEPGTVNHGGYEPAALLKFIETNWTLAPLTNRDRDATNLAAAFDFHRAPSEPTLMGAGQRPPIRQPHRATLYIGYATSIGVALAVVAWSLLAGRRRGTVHPKVMEPSR